MTAQCALHYGCPENFRDSLTTPTATIPNIFMCFCSDRPYECSCKFEVRSFTRSWDNRGYPKNLGQSLDTPTLPFLQNFWWAFIRIGPVNIPAKFEVSSFTRSWDNRGYSKQIWAIPGYTHASFSPKFWTGFYLHWPCKCTRQIWSP